MTRRHLPEDQGEALGALAHQLDKLRRDVDAFAAVRDDIAAHSRAIDALTRAVRRTDAGPGQAPDDNDSDSVEPPVPEWLTLSDVGLAIAWLTDLTVWVPRVWLRYPSAQLQPCWPWHPAVVAELLVARYAWADATVPGQGVLALAAWHDRWRPSAMTRINRAMTGCDRGGGCHVNRAGHHFHFDLAYLDELAQWWALTERPDPDAAPGLSREDRHEDRRTPAAARERGHR